MFSSRAALVYALAYVLLNNMSSSSCVVTEAMNAYQCFCSHLPRHLPEHEGPVDGCTALADFLVVCRWVDTYKQEHRNRWWELGSTEEILSMLPVPPLNEEAFVEVKELLNALWLPEPSVST